MKKTKIFFAACLLVLAAGAAYAAKLNTTTILYYYEVETPTYGGQIYNDNFTTSCEVGDYGCTAEVEINGSPVTRQLFANQDGTNPLKP